MALLRRCLNEVRVRHGELIVIADEPRPQMRAVAAGSTDRRPPLLAEADAGAMLRHASTPPSSLRSF